MSKNSLGILAACWGISGVSFILCDAIYRLAPYVVESFARSLNFYHWGFVILFTLFMAYFKGYKGFQKAFSPRVVARSLYLKDNITLPRLVLAPVFCMGFFHAAKKLLIVSYTLVFVIIFFLIGLKHLPQPWRGLVDAGVIIGLAWGLIVIFYFAARVLIGKPFIYSPETPDQP